MKPHLVLTGMMLAVLGGAQAGSLYRWVDKSGNVHYGDVPAGDAAQVEKKKISSGSSENNDAGLPYETLRARKNFPVTLYVADNCSEPCQNARDLLNKRGIPFSEKNLVTKEEIDAFKKMSGSETTPTLAVGNSWLKGFLAEQWNDELNIAGYPKTLPYRPQVPARPPADKPAKQAEPPPQ